MWVKPTDAPNSIFIGITTLHVSGTLSVHHQEFLAVVMTVCYQKQDGTSFHPPIKLEFSASVCFIQKECQQVSYRGIQSSAYYWKILRSIFSLKIQILMQWYAQNFARVEHVKRVQIPGALMNKFCTLAYDICWCSEWILLHCILRATWGFKVGPKFSFNNYVL